MQQTIIAVFRRTHLLTHLLLLIIREPKHQVALLNQIDVVCVMAQEKLTIPLRIMELRTRNGARNVVNIE